MTKFKKFGVFALSAVMSVSALSLAACDNNPKPTPKPPAPTVEEKDLIVPKTFDFDEQVKGSDWRLEEDSSGGYDVSYYRVENVVYCTNPTTPAEQSMRFFVPSAYLNDDGTLNKTATVNGYTSETAPIIYLNNCSGYAGGEPWYLDTTFRYAGTSKYYSWYYNYLNQGFVLVFVGERGKQTYDGNGNVIGVCPTSLVDLKAGIRFLKYNSDKIPGDTDKIISNGVSAGGAMSALIGVTGNSHVYDEYLEEIGAYMGDDADDSVFATQVYCPITDLDHAALAYEWMWQNDGTTAGWYSAMSELMAQSYAGYVNDLELKDENGDALTVEIAEDGSSHGGTFYEWLKAQYEKSYNHYVEVKGSDTDSGTYSWLSYDETNGASITSLNDMYTVVYDTAKGSIYNPRQKNCISFDTVTGSGGDNAVFGKPLAKANSADSWRHYTPDIPALIEQLKDEYPDEYDSYYQAYKTDTEDPEVLEMIDFYNPYKYIEPNSDGISQTFRICVGTQDRDTSPTVSAILALLLQNAGYDVEYNLMWNMPHIDADYAGEFEAWVNSLCKPAAEAE